VFAVLLTITAVDQILKWWAWRNVPGVFVDYGGGVLLSPEIGSLYQHAITGAVLDLVDSAVVISAAWLLLRRRRALPVLISGSILLGGWSSDLLDRLFMHYVTAPGSVRGVVDFIPIAGRVYNIADVCIVVGTVLLILSLVGVAVRGLAARRPARAAAARPDRPHRRRRIAALGLAIPVALVAIVGLGAVKFGGLTAPTASATVGYQPRFITHDGTVLEVS
jgi:lipoprotein signal peptidase